MTVEQAIKMKAEFYAAVNNVASIYARFHATRITTSEDSDEYKQWMAAYEQSDHRQKNLWGFIFSCCYREAFTRSLDNAKASLMPE